MLAKLLQVAISNGDTAGRSDIRSKLNKLGMFQKDERARAEIDRFQRSKRARTQLEAAIATANNCGDPVVETFVKAKDASEMFELQSSWVWTDIQRLSNCSQRARKYGEASYML